MMRSHTLNKRRAEIETNLKIQQIWGPLSLALNQEPQRLGTQRCGTTPPSKMPKHTIFEPGFFLFS